MQNRLLLLLLTSAALMVKIPCDDRVLILPCYASRRITRPLSCQPAKEPTDKTSLGERQYISLQRSVSVHSRAEVIITHAPSTLDACETHAPSIEKSIASLVLWFC
jgi:hypothetical protein